MEMTKSTVMAYFIIYCDTIDKHLRNYPAINEVWYKNETSANQLGRLDKKEAKAWC